MNTITNRASSCLALEFQETKDELLRAARRGADCAAVGDPRGLQVPGAENSSRSLINQRAVRRIVNVKKKNWRRKRQIREY